jgi:uncharacterized protein YegP (UPF0339 family)
MTKRTPTVKFTQDKRGMWRWAAIAANGKTVADGAEGYKTKAACLDGAAIALQLLSTAPDIQLATARRKRLDALADDLRAVQPVETARKKITRRRKK